MSAMMVPDGWEVKTFGNAGIQLIDGDRGSNYPSENDFSDSGYCLFLSAKNVTNNGFKFKITQFITQEKDLQLSKGKLQKGDIVLTTRGTVGNLAFYDDAIPFQNIRINSGMLILRNTKDISTLFLYQQLKSFILNKQIERIVFGSAQPQLTVKEVNKLWIYIPNILEQQKIATILSTLDRTIEATQKLIDKEKMIKKGLMANLLTHGIDDQGRIRSPQTHIYIDSPLGMIPKEWNTTTLGDTAIFNAGYAFKNHELSEFGLKVVRISNLHKSSFPYWHYDGKIKKTWIVDKGDLLFSWAGVANSIDCVKYEGELALLNQHIFNLKIKDQVLKEFTFQYLQFHLPRLREEIEGGAGQLHLTKSKIESICIPDMKLLEKKKIVELFTAQDRKIETEETNLAKLQKLKKGLIGDLLSGDVRVKV